MLFIMFILFKAIDGEGVARIKAPIPLKPYLYFTKLTGFLYGGGLSI